jgi:hypothetical protein
VIQLVIEKENNIGIIKNFIKFNTPISSLKLGGLRNLDFSEELNLNTHIVKFSNPFPWSKFYIERNLLLLEIDKKFKVIQISKANTFDLLFHFEKC